MENSYRIDEIDRAILIELLKDARKSYQDIAKDLIISGGTVHVRLNKMREAGIILGSKIVVDFRQLGYEVCAFIGINLVSARDYQKALSALEKFPEVVDIHYTTGQYSMFAKIIAKSTNDLHLFLVEKLQTISAIRSTETFISLDNPIKRDAEIPKGI